MERFWEKVGVGTSDQCWVWQASFTPNGYGKFWSDGRYIGAHRVAWELHHHRGVGAGRVIRHTCDNRACVNPAHLRQGTPKQNSRDMVDRGRSAVGEQNGQSKLTESEALEIRNDPRSQRKIAEDYGVNKSVVRDIQQHITWRHVQ